MEKKELYKLLLGLIPVRNHGEHEARIVLENAFKEFIQILKSQTDNCITDDIIKGTDNICTTILECYDYIYSGDHLKAYNILSARLDSLSYIKVIIQPHDSFYRIRQREDEKLFDHIDMQPIPGNLRHIVKTQRYSSPGIPCLYLGMSINACWEEMHRPQIGGCMISRYEAIQPFTLISLSIPSLESFLLQTEQVIMLYPLIMSCMVEVADYKDSFKSAYIIPQLVMEWLMTVEGGVKQDIKGIRYTSVHINDDFDFPPFYFENIAIPVPGPKKLSFCKKIDKLFKITDPTCEEFERIKMNLELGVADFDELQTPNGKYKYSLFGLIEENLKDTDKFPLKEMQYE